MKNKKTKNERDYKGRAGELVFINYTHPFDHAPPTEILRDNGFIKLTKSYIAVSDNRFIEAYFIDAKGGFLLGQYSADGKQEAFEAYEKLVEETDNEK
jgi:hypothetical protein